MSEHPGILHIYAPNRVAFEHSSPTPSPANILIFIGGLSDGLLTTSFVLPLKAALPATYSLVEILLSSSYNGWGTSSLDQDVDEIAQCVAYFRDLRSRNRGKIVLLGHSTGSQDVIHYLLSEEGHQTKRPRVDGAILQAGISDREAFDGALSPDIYERGVRVAREYVDDGRGGDCLPTSITAPAFSGPVSARRWLSLMSPGPDHAGQDDYFSSDFDDERLRGTFGKIGKTGIPVSILYGGNDEGVPVSVDKERLVSRWVNIIKEGGGVVDGSSGIIPGATHSYREGGEPREELIRRVLGFLGRVEGQ